MRQFAGNGDFCSASILLAVMAGILPAIAAQDAAAPAAKMAALQLSYTP